MQRVHSSVRESSDWARVKDVGLREFLNDYERELILIALEESSGSQRRAAQTLRVLPTSLCERMKRLGIRRKTTFQVGPEHAQRPPRRADDGSGPSPAFE